LAELLVGLVTDVEEEEEEEEDVETEEHGMVVVEEHQ
jgi:hypothetical protein